MALISSPYPLHDIWSMHQLKVAPDYTINLNIGAQDILITRPEFELKMTLIPSEELQFVQLLLIGKSLETAFPLAHNFVTIFNLLLSNGTFSNVMLPPK